MSSARIAATALTAAALAVACTASAAAASLPELPHPQADDRARAIDCMTSAILYEAGFEPVEGQEAVAEVILNRVHSPAFPKTVCGVVFQGSDRRTGCQFTFACDGSLRRTLPVEAAIRARAVATRAIDGLLTVRTAGATHYHADYVSPYWAPTLVRVAAIGRHIFYRQPGGDSVSHLGRYDAVGESEPTLLGNRVRGAAAALGETKSNEPHDSARFTLWGLSPESLAKR